MLSEEPTMTRHTLMTALFSMVAASVSSGQHDAGHHAMQLRAQQAMGFDQERSAHHFLIQKTGGAIEITAKDPADLALAKEIRAHLRHIRSAFSEGNFALPVFIHDKLPPGTDVLKARRETLAFRYEDLPSGGKVLVTTADAEALAALHAFLKFQITEHRTGDPLEPR
jgi:hypothetical protein